jgi:predicted RNA-binding Zn ribbon-like protein
MQVSFDDYTRAAAVVTELVNTAPGVWSGVDKLPDAEALGVFLGHHGLAGRPADGGDLPAVHALRDRLRALIEEHDPARLAAGASALTAAVGTVTLDGSHGGWAVTVPDEAPAAELLGVVGGLGILAVLLHLGPERFRPCSADTCSGVYIDTSRPGRRRYCMPGLCGNRVNVAAHRARRRGSEGISSPSGP